MVVLSPEIQTARFKRLQRQSKLKALEVYIELLVSDLIRKQTPLKDIPKIVNSFFKDIKGEYKSLIIQQIEKRSGLAWYVIKMQDSAGISRGMRLERHFNHVKKVTQQKAVSARRKQINILSDLISKGEKSRYAKAYGIKNLETDLNKVSDSIRRDLGRSINKFTDYAETRLIKTEARSAQHTEFLKENGTRPVKWVLGDNPCPICAPLGGSVYNTASDAPMIPVHPNCECRLEVI
jgi:hypothetical protein